jgi:hypothetical protein
MTGIVAAVAIALQLVNVNSQGVQGDGHSLWAAVSRDGRLVVFDSFARNLSSRPLQRPEDQEVYLRNRRSGRTRMVSLNSRGGASNAWSWMPSLSPQRALRGVLLDRLEPRPARRQAARAAHRPGA